MAKALSPTQVKALLKAARDTRSEALYVVAVHTGLRQGELLGLKWTDIDLDMGRLSVRRSLKVTEGGLDFGPPKNKASRRSVPLNNTTAAALRAHTLRQNEERLRSPGRAGGTPISSSPTASVDRPTTTTSTTESTNRSYNAPGSRARALPSTRYATPSQWLCL